MKFTTLATLFLTLCTIHISAGQSKKGGRVFVTSRTLTPLMVYAPPEVRNKHSNLEPQQESRSFVPSVLCGAHVLAPDILLSSVRCTPRLAESVDVYEFPADVQTPELQRHLDTARLLKGAVTKVTFHATFNLPSGEVVSNAALVQLDKPYFTS